MILSGFDLATRLSGWCVGAGDRLPQAGVWSFPQAGADLGALLDHFDQALAAHIETHRPEACAYEAPILVINAPGRGTDKLLTIRKLYAMGAHLEWVCRRRGIACHEVDLRAVKKELAGFAKADKQSMVFAAEKLGVALPNGAGRDDAADAVGVWLLLLRATNRGFSERFDRALYGSRANALL